MYDCVKGPLDAKIDKKIIWIDLNKNRNITYSKIIGDIGFTMHRVTNIYQLRDVITQDETDG